MSPKSPKDIKLKGSKVKNLNPDLFDLESKRKELALSSSHSELDCHSMVRIDSGFPKEVLLQVGEESQFDQILNQVINEKEDDAQLVQIKL